MNTDAILLSDILKLSISQRIQLIEDIWESIVSFPESIDLTEAQQRELDNRLQNYYSDSSAGISWEELKSELMAT